jgi:prolyl-tRNA editing enzyme YbaK/EbsC (Cys-tRNA(Pro) deacylase)
MTNLLTPADLQAHIDRHGIQARLIPDIGPTPTVPAAAAALGVAPDQIVKTLLFVLNAGDRSDAPPAVVVIGSGEHRIDKRLLGARFGLNPKRVKLADPAVVLDRLGYPAGGVPPFGHRVRLPVLMDSAVVAAGDLDGGRLFAGGGDDRTMLELSLNTLLHAVQPEVLPLSRDRAAE